MTDPETSKDAAAIAARREAELAALTWQIAAGADEAIAEAPVDRFAAAAARKAEAATSAVEPARAQPTPASTARPPDAATDAGADIDSAALAAACADLDALRQAIADFEGCALRRGARNLVFADGNRAARVLVVGEAPGREEDRAGLPFVVRSGQLLDRMFAAIGLSRQSTDAANSLYITNVLPGRQPQNRDPSGDEIAMMRPFLERHIELAAPQILVTMGNPATKTLLDTTTGITRMRGTWAAWRGIPLMPMFHPAALLRDPGKKRAAWADLLAVQARLAERA